LWGKTTYAVRQALLYEESLQNAENIMSHLPFHATYNIYIYIYIYIYVIWSLVLQKVIGSPGRLPPPTTRAYMALPPHIPRLDYVALNSMDMFLWQLWTQCQFECKNPTI
jgi:hypothetical protein